MRLPTREFALVAKPMLAIFILIFGVTACVADVRLVKDQSTGRKQVFEYTLSPAAQANPAFRHRLIVPSIDRIPGNAITHYLRADGEGGLRPLETAQKEHGMVIYDWSGFDLAADEIDLAVMKKVCASFDGLVKNHLARASRCRDAEWGLALETLRGKDVLSFLLPSVQQSRNYSRILAMQTRLAIIEKRYDDAVELLRINYTLGRHVSKQGLFVSSLVGIAETGISNLGMKHLIGQDDSPNMYWALASLPQPVIDMTSASEYEASICLRILSLDDVETLDLTEAQWTKLLEKQVAAILESAQFAGQPGKKDSGLGSKTAMLGMAMLTYSSAKKRLVAGGMDAKKVESMPVAQVVLVDMRRELIRYSDLNERAYYIPFWDAQKLYEESENLMEKNRLKSTGAMVAGMLLPATYQVRNAQTRIQAEINILMAIESIRNHLATHNQLPAALAELELPVRADPYTGKPFAYSLENGTATIGFGKGSPLEYTYILKVK